MISVMSCASSANLGPGYDSASIALDAFHEILDVYPSSKRDSDRITVLDAKDRLIRNSPQQFVAESILDEYDSSEKIVLKSRGNIPWGSGLGSSGACSIATVVALSKLLNLGMNQETMVRYAALGEQRVSGTGHVDNIIASLIGGLIVIASVKPPRWHSVRVHPDLKLVIINVDLQVPEKTKRCRAVIPGSVDIDAAVSNARNLAMLILGLNTYNPDLIRSGMNDSIVEPARSSIYTYYPDLKRSLLNHGAIGVALSGAGPSLLCVLDADQSLNRIRDGTSQVLDRLNLPFNIVESGVCRGAVVEG